MISSHRRNVIQPGKKTVEGTVRADLSTNRKQYGDMRGLAIMAVV
jgi:hypothetical protein